jgi:hypothetical protein
MKILPLVSQSNLDEGWRCLCVFTCLAKIILNFVLGTELLAACTPMYDNTNPSEMAILIGVICMDMNMIVRLLFMR